MAKITLRSSVTSQLMHKTLLQGTYLASTAILILLYAGIFMPADQLTPWGWLLYAIALGLITLGMLPYRKLTMLEKKPNEIRLVDHCRLDVCLQGIPTLAIPYKTIAKIAYMPTSSPYGIALTFKIPVEEKIVLLNPAFKATAYQESSLSMYGCDCFLPYFSRRSFELLGEELCDSEVNVLTNKRG